MKQPTPRQLEILTLISLDVRDPAIAAGLLLSHKTVKTHVASALHRLQVHSRAAAVALCIRQGWI